MASPWVALGDVSFSFSTAPFDQPFNVLLTSTVFPSDPYKIDASTRLPDSMTVDYVRGMAFARRPDPEITR
jgi:hypothetical protein